MPGANLRVKGANEPGAGALLRTGAEVPANEVLSE
jgi:hypothetical protein